MKTKSRKQEERMGKLLKGRAIPASGALPSWKGDVDSGRGVFTDDWKAECKTTKNDYFFLKLSKLQLIEKQAEKVGRKPAFSIEFLNENVFEETEYVVVRKQDYVKFFPKNKVVSIKVSNKSVRLKKEDLDRAWLDDSRYDLEFEGKGQYVILHLLDYMKMVRKER